MIGSILLFWIGMQLNAPVWFYVLIGVNLLMRVFKFGIDMYKAGSKA